MIPSEILAQTPAPEVVKAGLAVVDWLIIALYAGGTIYLGWYFGRKQSSTKEYFTGDGQMNVIFVGVSLFATLLSTISYLSMPGEAIGKGPAWLTVLVAYPIIYFVVSYVILPVYMRQKVTSAYELLEDKLGRGTRTLGAVLFILLRLVWMSLLIFLTAKALVTIMAIDDKYIPVVMTIAGLVAVIYTSLGGLRAVVITDFIQTILLYGGAVIVIVIITIKMGGFGWFPTEMHENWDHQPFFSADPSVRLTIVGAILSVIAWYICTVGGDQVAVQRYMATKDLAAARRSLAIQLTVGGIVMVTLFIAGFALLGYFEANVAQLGEFSLKGDADKLFPHFIASGLPPIIAGLVVSAMFAAAMSSIDSGINSITAVVMTDFMKESKTDADEKRKFRQARIFAFIIGAIVIAFGSVMEKVPGNITAMTGKTANLLTVPIFTLFYFALFMKCAKPVGAWIGCLVSIVVAAGIAFSGPLFGFIIKNGNIQDPVSFQWITPASLVAAIIAGFVVSKILPEHDSPLGQKLKYIPAILAVGLVIGLFTVWKPSPRIAITDETRARCVEILREGMKGDDYWPSIHAAEGLTIGGHGDEVIAFLEPKLTGDFDDQQKCGLAREIIRAGDRSKVKVMLDILEGDDAFGHVHAAESLYKVHGIGDGKAMRAAMTGNGALNLRLMAAAALARSGDAEAYKFLRNTLGEADLEGIRISAWVLGRVGGKQDIEPLRTRLKDVTDPTILSYINHALAALGDKEGLAELSKNLDSEDGPIRTAAATFAGDSRAISVAPKLLKMLDDPHLDARYRAAQSLLDLSNR